MSKITDITLQLLQNACKIIAELEAENVELKQRLKTNYTPVNYQKHSLSESDAETKRILQLKNGKIGHLCKNCLDDPMTDNHHYSDSIDQDNVSLALEILSEERFIDTDLKLQLIAKSPLSSPFLTTLVEKGEDAIKWLDDESQGLKAGWYECVYLGEGESVTDCHQLDEERSSCKCESVIASELVGNKYSCLICHNEIEEPLKKLDPSHTVYTCGTNILLPYPLPPTGLRFKFGEEQIERTFFQQQPKKPEGNPFNPKNKISLSFSVERLIKQDNPCLVIRCYKDDIQIKNIAICSEHEGHPYSECIFKVTEENITSFIDFFNEVKQQCEKVGE